MYVARGAKDDCGDISAVQAQLNQGIQNVLSTDEAVLVQLSSGQCVAWGNAARGGDIAAVQVQLNEGVESVWSIGANICKEQRCSK